MFSAENIKQVLSGAVVLFADCLIAQTSVLLHELLALFRITLDVLGELFDLAIIVSKEKKIYNSTLNDVLERHCKAVGIPTISVHGLRHTHASLLLFDGVSIASVAQRLGHSSINTTQKTYLHIIRELENKDIDLIMKSISSLLD